MDVIKLMRAEKFEPRVIFDVGANIGSTVLEWTRTYPEARVFAFEPVSATFAKLTQRVGARPNVQANQMALGNSTGEVRMRAVPGGLANRILTVGQTSAEEEIVRVMKGEDFCTSNGIERIDFLKVDAEGHDLEVLKGFTSLLEKRAIGLIQLETGVSIHNKVHVPVWELNAFLQPLGYGLVGFGDECRRNPLLKTTTKGIYYCNVFFAAEEVSERELQLAEREKRLALHKEMALKREAAAAAAASKGKVGRLLSSLSGLTKAR